MLACGDLRIAGGSTVVLPPEVTSLNRSATVVAALVAAVIFTPGLAAEPPLELVGDGVARRLEWRDGSLVTTALVTQGAAGKAATILPVASVEFGIRLADGTLLTAADYAVAAADVVRDNAAGGLRITHRRRPDRAYPPDAAEAVEVRYERRPPVAGGPVLLVKSLLLTFPADAPAAAAVEVERLVVAAPAARGGRGEPVVLDGRFLLVPLDPSSLTRHTDGNTPAAYTRRFEKVGNHSFVDFEEADVEPAPQPGLVRCFHFPLVAPGPDGRGQIESHAVALAAVTTGTSAERFLLRALRPIPRANTHYNNWFDPAGKNLAGDSLPSIHRAFAAALAKSGVGLDALVPDNGWQNRRSVWEPSAGAFPRGMDDLAALGAKLRDQGTSLGLWMSLDQTTNDIGWLKSRGYRQAVPNAYFKRYFPHLSLADPRYRDALAAQLARLVDDCGVGYFKFDFNHLSHAVPTDRHGHEAEVAAMLELCRLVRDKAAFVNATNWTWHAPAWLLHADTVWLLAGDDGFNANWPELAGRAQATTDRDAYFWRMWGDPADRPWFPISAVMTHGIIRNARGQMSFATDTPRDWCDHVLMHYGRGTLLREWYLSPAAVQPHEWAALVAIHRWADARRPSLAHACYVGGRPDEGHAYGYVGFDDAGRSGTLVARNPAAADATLRVPLDEATLFPGAAGSDWRARIVYPWRQELPMRLVAGEVAEFSIPGYATVAIELEPGEPTGPVVKRGSVVTSVAEERPGQATVTLADVAAERLELLVIGRPTLPEVLLDGAPARPLRTAVGKLNAFAGYARDGMTSEAAAPWEMASFNLASLAGKAVTVTLRGAGMTAEAWVLADQPDDDAATVDRETPLTFPGSWRETVPVLAGPVAPPRRATPEEIAAATAARIELEAFGNDADRYGDKTVLLAGHPIGVLPPCGDAWRPASLPLDGDTRRLLAAENVVSIQTADPADKFKVRRVRIVLVLPDGAEVVGPASEAFVSDPDWAHAAGAAPFATPAESGPIDVKL
jgi:hypothetical protein